MLLYADAEGFDCRPISGAQRVKPLEIRDDTLKRFDFADNHLSINLVAVISAC